MMVTWELLKQTLKCPETFESMVEHADVKIDYM